MFLVLPLVLAATELLLGSAAALAQGEPVGAACPPGEVCGTARLGGWAMIAVGLVFFAVWLMPARPESAEGEQSGWTTRVPMLQVLQKRMDKELSGWRRLQWPIVGLFFTALGVATIMGWR
ncbi:MAG: hypothetical protein ACE5GS_14570 [Kiloniellaceae bacterium]